MGATSDDRACKSCGHFRPKTEYSTEQWAQGTGSSYCRGCVANADGANEGEPIDESRDNKDANKFTFDRGQLQTPFAQGQFRWVASGKYSDGSSMDGKKGVSKWFKTGATFESTYFDLDIEAVDQAIKLVAEFNKEEIVRGIIRVNRPAVWRFMDNCGPAWAGKKYLQEPYIHNYQRFNSNTGWSNTKVRWGDIMQALSHFSYDNTGGKAVLVDLQGGVYPNGAILTDPVILSADRSYGVTDLGPRGISSFFAAHTCTDFCRRSWSKPADTKRYYSAVETTTMEALSKLSVG